MELKIALVAICAASTLASNGGVNLVKDADVNSKPLSSEFRLFGSAKQGGISDFEEDATWNRCAKLELKACDVSSAGVTNVNLGLQVGGDAKHAGFPVRGGSKYRFSFEMRGDAPMVIIVQRTWDSKGKVTQKATPMNTVKPQKEWTAYKGEFEAPADAVRGVLLFQFWGKLPRYVEVCNPPYFILVDKIRIEEVTFGREIWPGAAIVVPDGGAAECSGFRSLENSDVPARLPTRMTVKAADDALNFRFAFDGAKPLPNKSGTGVWTHDLVELIFASDALGNLPPVHLALNAAGVKWMSGNDPDYSLWEGRPHVREDGWDAVVSVSWKALGYAAKPPKGTQIRFNAMREHTVAEASKLDPAKGNRCGRGWLLDDSVCSFAGTEFGNPERFGVIILGDDPKYGDDPSAWWYANRRRQEDERLAKLMREKMVVAQVPMHTNPDIPYLPPEIFEPQSVFRLRAAVNERTALPVAIANMTDAMEEYRVALVRGFEPPTEAFEHPMPLAGLKRADGKAIGHGKITMRRGVRFRDSNAKQHGARYDILAKMNDVSAVPVAPKEAGLAWIQIDCHGVEPGLYKGELVVTPLVGGRFERHKMSKLPNGAKTMEIFDDSKRIPVELEILPFALAEPTDFALNGFRTGWKDYQIEFMNQYDCMDFIVTPWFFDMTFNPDGSAKTAQPRSFQVPHLKELHKRVRKLGKRPRVMIAYGCYANFKRFHMRDSGIKFDTPEYWTAWRNWLKYVEKTMNDNGFPNDDYVMEVYDEPNLKEWPMDEVVRSYKEAKAAVPKMKLLNTNGERAFFKAVSPYVDHWYFSQYVFGDKTIMEYPKEMLAAGKTVSMYACGTNMRQDLYRYCRMLSWKAANIGSDFVSLYQFYDQQPGCSFRQATCGAVAYDTSYEAVPSIRLENLYAGMTDIRYLKLLERKAKAAGDAPEAKAALAFVRKSIHDVPLRYPHDETGASRFRDECIKHLLKLQ